MSENLPKSFFDLINSAEKPVLVDFYADWCGPCKMVSPVVRQIAKEYRDRIMTVKINVDKKPSVAGRYQITGIPTIMLFKNGQPAMRLQGAQPYQAIVSELNKALQ